VTIDLRAYIRLIPDFPEHGIVFRDITPLLAEPKAFAAALDAMTDYVTSRSVDAIVAIDSRGFIFGAPIANRLGLPFVPVRKPGKLPFDRMSVEYALEYGSGQLDLHTDALKPGQSVVIIDDLLATGGTADGAVQLVEMVEARVAGIAFLVELTGLEGRKRLEGYEVFAVLQIE
jgi:adenine phosphoribosyltransferase